MIADLVAPLLVFTLVLSVTSLVVMLLRERVRQLAGSGMVYALWLIVPAALLACLAPALPHATIAHAPVVGRLIVPLDVAGSAIPAAPIKTATSLWRLAAPYMIGVWIFGLGLSAMRIVWLQRVFVRALGGLTRDPRRPNIFYSERTGVSPSVIGLIRSRIVLPADFYRLYSTDEQALILAHETTHVRERHPLTGAVAVFLLAVQWFNPIAYFAFVRFRLDQELACDAAVVSAYPKARAVYARAMLKARVSFSNPPLAYCWTSTLSLSMKERIELLKAPPPSPAKRLIVGAGIGLLTLASGCGVYAMTPHQTVFAPPSASNGQSAIQKAKPVITSAVEVAQTNTAVQSSPSQVRTISGGLSNFVRPFEPEQAVPSGANPASDVTPSPYYEAIIQLVLEDDKRRGQNFPAPTVTRELVNGSEPMLVLDLGYERLAGPDGAELKRKLAEFQRQWNSTPPESQAAVSGQTETPAA